MDILIKKKNKTIEKGTKNVNSSFTEGETLSSKHFLKCKRSLKIWEMQMKTTMSYLPFYTHTVGINLKVGQYQALGRLLHDRNVYTLLVGEQHGNS